jgi:hypothetical protein
MAPVQMNCQQRLCIWAHAFGETFYYLTGAQILRASLGARQVLLQLHKPKRQFGLREVRIGGFVRGS